MYVCVYIWIFILKPTHMQVMLSYLRIHILPKNIYLFSRSGFMSYTFSYGKQIHKYKTHTSFLKERPYKYFIHSDEIIIFVAEVKDLSDKS